MSSEYDSVIIVIPVEGAVEIRDCAPGDQDGPGLAALQEAVGGLIELAWLLEQYEGLGMLVNEEGLMMGLRFNERATAVSQHDYLAGPAVIVADGGENFRPLTRRQAIDLLARFADNHGVLIG